MLLVQILRMVVAAAFPEARPAEANPAWWVVQLIIALVSALISYALRPKVEPPKPAEADMPTTEDGRAVPEAHGTVWIEDEFMLAYKVMGRVPIGFVEGSCVGGSTEINSGFWHRTPRETLLRWKAQYGLDVTPKS